MRHKPKVRLCVCGNFQDSQPHMKDENAAETVPVEIVRLMLALLARNPSWNALSLDVSAVFLNAVLGNKETILMKPIGPSQAWFDTSWSVATGVAGNIWAETISRLMGGASRLCAERSRSSPSGG